MGAAEETVTRDSAGHPPADRQAVAVAVVRVQSGEDPRAVIESSGIDPHALARGITDDFDRQPPEVRAAILGRGDAMTAIGEDPEWTDVQRAVLRSGDIFRRPDGDYYTPEELQDLRGRYGLRLGPEDSE